MELQLEFEKKKKILTGQLISDEYINQKKIEFAKELEAEWNKKES